jgi:hypothetical protein
MSGRYNLVKEFIIKPVKNLIKAKKTSPTIVGTRPNVGNLKFNKDTIDKLTKTTDAYVTKAGSVDPGLKKALRDAGSKSLKKTDNILRRNKESKKMFKTVENKKDGGRMGLKKGGGSDLGMQSVKHGIDNNPKITAADPKAKFIAAAKNKKSKKKVI